MKMAKPEKRKGLIADLKSEKELNDIYINHLKEAIRNGTFKIDVEVIATKILKDKELSELFLKDMLNKN